MKRVLVVSYLFPPTGDVGVHRTLRFIKWLPTFDWQPVVLTARNAKVQNLEPSLLEKVPQDVPVHRCYSFEALNAGTTVGATNGKTDASRTKWFLHAIPGGLWSHLAVPDEKRGWVPFAVRSGARLANEHRFDAIYVTGKPFSSYLIGEALSRRLDIPWVMDLRDLWTLNRRVKPKNRWHAYWNPRLERRLVSSAAAVIANTPGNRDDFIRKFAECSADRFFTITNGYDRDDFRDLPRQKYEKFTISYSGAFYYRKKQARDKSIYETYSPRYLFQAIATLFAEDPGMQQRTQLVFTGSGCRKARGLVAEYGLESNVRLRGWISYRESLEVLLRSHLLPLMLSSGDESRGWIPSKLFQYIGAGTPVLAMVPQGDVADIVAETEAGEVVPPDDVDAIRDAVRRAYEQFVAGVTPSRYNVERVESYEARELSRKLASCLEEISGTQGRAARAASSTGTVR